MIDAIATRNSIDEIGFRFIVTGDRRWLEFPKAKHPSDQRRRDELWQTTCFEAFVRGRDTASYFELNQGPDGDWAAYSFTTYREGMSDALGRRRRFRSDPRFSDWFDLSFAFTLPDAPSGSWSVGVSAIIEGQDGAMSYWALAHPPGAPDFHHPACFAATLPPPRAA